MNVSFKPIVHRHRKRKDNNYSVIIRIGFKSKYAYIETDLSVNKSDLNRKYEITNRTVLDKCNMIIKFYRDIISKIDISSFDVQEIKSIILNREDKLDFIVLFEKFIDYNSPSIGIHRAGLNHIKRFSGDHLPIDNITPKFLSDFENYLSQKMGSRGVNLYLSVLRTFYNKIIDEYEYKGYTFNYPFRKYKIPKAKYNNAVSLTKNQLDAILNIKLKGIRANRARDIFVISLLTLGTNATDLYHLESINNGRIEYKRNKTRRKRDDEAFISIKIEPELIPYIEKYKGKNMVFCFSELYKSVPKFNECIRVGLKQMVDQINQNGKIIDHLEFYDARRTMASIMRNKLGISKDDVSLCLNHVDNNKITDIYIEKDFSILDKCNRLFIDYIYK